MEIEESAIDELRNAVAWPGSPGVSGVLYSALIRAAGIKAE